MVHDVRMDSLLQETLMLARATELPIPKICREAAVKERWYRRFIAGDFTDPGVNKVERLNRVLKQHKRRAA
jgi:hypothetical protein